MQNDTPELIGTVRSAAYEYFGTPSILCVFWVYVLRVARSFRVPWFGNRRLV